MNNVDVTVSVNGTTRSASVEARTLLSDFLRHDLGLTGTHVGCEQGVCGSCTVILDGSAVRSCLMLAAQVDGQSVETVEALAEDGQLNRLQQAMMNEHGIQCGFCTPGILMSLTAAQRAKADVEEACTRILGGHVCRCTGYNGIRAAITRCWTEQLDGAR
jgi:aerobic-type carbon monoxide dehydrogenase small subunit (CoxS/CutS family)